MWKNLSRQQKTWIKAKKTVLREKRNQKSRFQEAQNQLVNGLVRSKLGAPICGNSAYKCVTEVINFLPQNISEKTETSWEQVEIDASHLAGAKFLVNLRKVSPKSVENFLYHSIKGSLNLFLEASENFWGFPMVRCDNLDYP